MRSKPAPSNPGTNSIVMRPGTNHWTTPTAPRTPRRWRRRYGWSDGHSRGGRPRGSGRPCSGSTAEPGPGDERDSHDAGADGVGRQAGGAADDGNDPDDDDAGRLAGKAFPGDGGANRREFPEVADRESEVVDRQRQRVPDTHGERDGDEEAGDVAEAGRQGGSLDAESRDGTDTEDEGRVQEDIHANGSHVDADGRRPCHLSR